MQSSPDNKNSDDFIEYLDGLVPESVEKLDPMNNVINEIYNFVEQQPDIIVKLLSCGIKNKQPQNSYFLILKYGFSSVIWVGDPVRWEILNEINKSNPPETIAKFWFDYISICSPHESIKQAIPFDNIDFQKIFIEKYALELIHNVNKISVSSVANILVSFEINFLGIVLNNYLSQKSVIDRLGKYELMCTRRIFMELRYMIGSNDKSLGGRSEQFINIISACILEKILEIKESYLSVEEDLKGKTFSFSHLFLEIFESIGDLVKFDSSYLHLLLSTNQIYHRGFEFIYSAIKDQMSDDQLVLMISTLKEKEMFRILNTILTDQYNLAKDHIERIAGIHNDQSRFLKLCELSGSTITNLLLKDPDLLCPLFDKPEPRDKDVPKAMTDDPQEKATMFKKMLSMIYELHTFDFASKWRLFGETLEQETPSLMNFFWILHLHKPRQHEIEQFFEEIFGKDQKGGADYQHFIDTFVGKPHRGTDWGLNIHATKLRAIYNSSDYSRARVLYHQANDLYRYTRAIKFIYDTFTFGTLATENIDWSTHIIMQDAWAKCFNTPFSLETLGELINLCYTVYKVQDLYKYMILISTTNQEN